MPGFLGVEIEDLSYGLVAVMHSLDDRGPYDRIILIAGVRRDRQPGGVYCYRWEHPLSDPEEVQARVVEAVTGVISLDNMLIIATSFKLPRDVVVIEVEAAGDSWGEGFTPQVETAVPAAIEMIRSCMAGEYVGGSWNQGIHPGTPILPCP
jgi:Ni,Fe-hydrogenase maturation factor